MPDPDIKEPSSRFPCEDSEIMEEDGTPLIERIRDIMEKMPPSRPPDHEIHPRGAT